MSKPHDARALRSRKALGDALLRLIETRPIAQIQIKELTAEAGVSYPVFFRQFKRIDEVLDEIATAEIQSLLTFVQPSFLATSRRESIRALCGYVQAHRGLWTQLLTTNASSAMRAEFSRQAELTVARRGRQVPSLPSDLVGTIVVNGIFEVITWWLRQPDDYPVEDVVNLLLDLVIEPVYRHTER